jgi:hypothetical protein
MYISYLCSSLLTNTISSAWVSGICRISFWEDGLKISQYKLYFIHIIIGIIVYITVGLCITPNINFLITFYRKKYIFDVVPDNLGVVRDCIFYLTMVLNGVC